MDNVTSSHSLGFLFYVRLQLHALLTFSALQNLTRKLVIFLSVLWVVFYNRLVTSHRVKWDDVHIDWLIRAS